MIDQKTKDEFSRKPVRWYYGIAAVLLALFVFLGPLALPLLWRSPRFNRAWKTALTLAVIIFTVVMVWLTWETNAALIRIFMGEVRKIEAS